MVEMKRFDVTDYGVIPDCGELQTGKIQAVIEACRNNGGGEIYFPPGSYCVGSLRLYSHMTLNLGQDATLIGSRNHGDYTDFHVPSTLGYLKDSYYIKAWNLPPYYIYGIVCAFEEENISIIGREGSMIDGQDCLDANGEEGFRGPMGIILCKCRNIHLEGYTFANSANWSHQLDSCNEVVIKNVTVVAGHDGFNLHHSKNIQVDECRIESGDDCFAGYDIENLEVSSCYVNTACNSMRIGGCGLRFRDCIFEGPGRYPHISENTYHTHAVFKYYSMRADRIENDGQDILFKDCLITGAAALLSYQYGKEGLHQDNRPLRSLVFEHSRITRIDHTSYFKGNGEPCRLEFRDCEIDFQGKDGEAFLEIDDSIELTMEQVYFGENTEGPGGISRPQIVRICNSRAASDISPCKYPEKGL